MVVEGTEDAPFIVGWCGMDGKLQHKGALGSIIRWRCDGRGVGVSWPETNSVKPVEDIM